MKAYPKYKDSGVPWLGEVPEHWEICRLSSQFVERKEKVSDKDFLPLSVTKKGILPQLETAAKSKDGENRKKVCAGDFVINSRSDRKGSSGVSQYTGSVSLINTVLTPISLDIRYVHNFFRSHAFQEEFYRVGCGIVADLWSTKYAEMRTIMIPVPSQDEQQQIVRYLDWKTSLITKFIKAKKKLIALLKEQKQNIINKAVTKGINPDVRMKDSGVAWIGEIPEHWEVRRIKTFSKILRGKFSFRPRNDSSLYGGDHPFIQTGDIARAGKYIKTYNQTLNEKGFQISKEFPRGTLTMTIAANIGEVAILDYIACFPDSIVGFLPTESIVDFLYYIFITMKPELLTLAPVNTQGNLNVERIGNAKSVLPSIDEQNEIVIYIEKETALIDKTISRIEQEIELMHEYRTRLVSDAVTGKIDVRSVKIPDFEPVEPDLEMQDDEEPEDEILAEDIEK